MVVGQSSRLGLGLALECTLSLDALLSLAASSEWD